MADQNPMADPRVVPVDLAVEQTEILRDELLGWLAGIEEDLATDQLPDRGAVAREADAFRRLLTALDRSEIELPDEEARKAMSDAHQALLSLLG